MELIKLNISKIYRYKNKSAIKYSKYNIIIKF